VVGIAHVREGVDRQKLEGAKKCCGRRQSKQSIEAGGAAQNNRYGLNSPLALGRYPKKDTRVRRGLEIRTTKKPLSFEGGFFELVAGAGFEPTTFRL